MNTPKRILSMLLLLVCLITGSVTAFAATGTKAPSESTAAVGTKVFDGYKVTVLDKTTPATSIRGRTTDRNVMCFVSAADKEVGTISYADYNAISQKYKKTVALPGGGSYGAPPVEGKSWEEWFADEFNKFRGISAGSKDASLKEAEEANAAANAELAEKYRQEVIDLVNKEREKAGMQSLSADDNAMEYAQTRAQEIAISYSHIRPDGLEKPFDELGAMNENIAMGQSTPESVVSAWMNSPGHRANILGKDMYAIGVGCYINSTSIYWTQEFLW